MSSLSRSQTLLAPPGQGVPSQTDGMSSGGEVGATGAVTPSGLAGVGVAVGQIPLRVIYLTIEKRASAPRVYDIPIEAVDTWEKFLQTLLYICPPEAKALLISSDGPNSSKSYIIPSTWPSCLIPGREFLLQLGSCIKDADCPVCFKLHKWDVGSYRAGGGGDSQGGGGGGAGARGSAGGEVEVMAGSGYSAGGGRIKSGGAGGSGSKGGPTAVANIINQDGPHDYCRVDVDSFICRDPLDG